MGLVALGAGPEGLFPPPTHPFKGPHPRHRGGFLHPVVGKIDQQNVVKVTVGGVGEEVEELGWEEVVRKGVGAEAAPGEGFSNA